MRFQFLKNLSLSETRPLEHPPWSYEVNRPDFDTKEEFRNWCNIPTTNHLFYSLCEGADPGRRISDVENPPRLMHGFIADYDANPDMEKVRAYIQKRSVTTRPVMLSRTFSQGLRAVWLFEEPVKVDCPELAEAFMRQLGKDLKVENLAPGFDHASFKFSQYYEVGSDWEEVEGGMEMPRELTLGMMVSASRTAKLPMESRYAIPMEAVEAEVEARWPGRWVGEFVAGARGPLFWIDDGIDRIGCQVFPEGVVSYSTRSPESFLSWKKILGPGFVREFELKKETECTEGFFWDTNKYWSKENKEQWTPLGKEDLLLRFRDMGLSHRAAKGELMSEADEMMLAVQRLHRVDLAAPVVFDKREFIEYKGVRILNVSRVKPVAPSGDLDAADKCPWLREFLTRLWDPRAGNHGIPPHEFFFAWLKRFWESSLQGTPLPGQALIISGPVDKGKSLLGTVILPTIMGGTGADAGAYLVGSDKFNRDICAAGVWAIDDNKSAATKGDHMRFGEALKKLVAVPEVIYRPMRTDPVGIPWAGRIVLTCNDDSESLAAIPNLDNNILDKLLLFKVDKNWRADFGDYGSMHRKLRAEIPHFLQWLSDKEVPAGILAGASGRYGVNPYHHPELLADARNMNPSHRVTEILDLWVMDGVKTNRTPWSGTSTELMAELYGNPVIKDLVRDQNPIRLGVLLSKIDYYKPMRSTRIKGKTRYFFEFREELLIED
jgi:hypothetical protein